MTELMRIRKQTNIKGDTLLCAYINGTMYAGEKIDGMNFAQTWTTSKKVRYLARMEYNRLVTNKHERKSTN